MEIIDAGAVEFGVELVKAVPYAYYLHVRSELEKVITCKDMKWFYYFAKCEEIYGERNPRNYYAQVGQMTDFVVRKLPEKWLPPPYEEYYGKNNIFGFDKPLCVISNKYNMEFGGGGVPPINYLRLDVLKEIIEYLKDRYTIIFNRQTPDIGILDHQKLLDYGDFELMKNYKEVLLIQDLMKKFDMSYNEIQVKLFSKCDKFISVMGGNSILSSYFGGTNIIFVVKSHEFECDTYNNWYHRFSGCEIIVARDNKQLIKAVKGKY